MFPPDLKREAFIAVSILLFLDVSSPNNPLGVKVKDLWNHQSDLHEFLVNHVAIHLNKLVDKSLILYEKLEYSTEPMNIFLFNQRLQFILNSFYRVDLNVLGGFLG